MNAMKKSLLAVSILVAAGAANAATIGTYNVTLQGRVSTYGNTTGTGTATLSDTGVLTLTMTETGVTPNIGGPGGFNYTMTTTEIFNGTIVGGAFKAPGTTVPPYATVVGTLTPTSCVDNNTNVACTPLNTAPANFTNVRDTCVAIAATTQAAPVGGVAVVQPALGACSALTTTLGGGGILRGNFNSGGGTTPNINNYTFSNFTPSTIPVPAAAWLFGSGLLGLAGTARRRRSA